MACFDLAFCCFRLLSFYCFDGSSITCSEVLESKRVSRKSAGRASFSRVSEPCVGCWVSIGSSMLSWGIVEHTGRSPWFDFLYCTGRENQTSIQGICWSLVWSPGPAPHSVMVQRCAKSSPCPKCLQRQSECSLCKGNNTCLGKSLHAGLLTVSSCPKSYSRWVQRMSARLSVKNMLCFFFPCTVKWCMGRCAGVTWDQPGCSALAGTCSRWQ